jgi:hypothetical protein
MTILYKTYIGIDPGKTGAIAIIRKNNKDAKEKIEIYDCPPTINEMVSIFIPVALEKSSIKALIEKVNPFFKSSAKSAFTFGCNFCAWQGIMSTLNIPYDFISPRKWQGLIFDSAKKEENTKMQSFERVQRLYPNLGIELKTKRGKILDGRCDALLLAKLCSIMYEVS